MYGQKLYVFSSGGSDYRSQGFSLYYENSEYVLKVADKSQVWKAFISSQEIPINSWFSFAFTWSKGNYFFGFILVRNSVSLVSQKFRKRR